FGPMVRICNALLQAHCHRTHSRVAPRQDSLHSHNPRSRLMTLAARASLSLLRLSRLSGRRLRSLRLSDLDAALLSPHRESVAHNLAHSETVLPAIVLNRLTGASGNGSGNGEALVLGSHGGSAPYASDFNVNPTSS